MAAHLFYFAASRYATGGQINDDSVNIHDFFIDSFTPEPVHLLVNMSPASNRIAVSAVMRYASSTVVKYSGTDMQEIREVLRQRSVQLSDFYWL